MMNWRAIGCRYNDEARVNVGHVSMRSQRTLTRNGRLPLHVKMSSSEISAEVESF